MDEESRIVVLVDEDHQDCLELKDRKDRMEQAAAAAGLMTKSAAAGGRFVVLNRIVVEELEAWFIGDPAALADAFPGVSRQLGSKVAYRKPEAIAGGTWEALERVLQRAGYYAGGISKIEVARCMANQMDPDRNTSPSFSSICTRIGGSLAAGGLAVCEMSELNPRRLPPITPRF
ncbi:MAG: hypothetical protein JWL90_4334 [Chthoniobacteraceae bacterium]|nr:hypothetical protein [Chthoniobacteraceae bacterium]